MTKIRNLTVVSFLIFLSLDDIGEQKLFSIFRGRQSLRDWKPAGRPELRPCFFHGSAVESRVITKSNPYRFHQAPEGRVCHTMLTKLKIPSNMMEAVVKKFHRNVSDEQIIRFLGTFTDSSNVRIVREGALVFKSLHASHSVVELCNRSVLA